MAQCLVPECSAQAAEGIKTCLEHASARRRCDHVDAAGVQCRKRALPGVLQCSVHGGASKSNERSVVRARTLTAMERFVKPYDGPADPVSAFEMEFRRTLGRIAWLEWQLSQLRDEQELIFGLSKTETIGASEFTGTNKTYTARIHVFEDMLRWERVHLLDMEKIWLKADIANKQLNMLAGSVDYAYTLVFKALEQAGLDPTSAETRGLVARVFEHELKAEKDRI